MGCFNEELQSDRAVVQGSNPQNIQHLLLMLKGDFIEIFGINSQE